MVKVYIDRGHGGYDPGATGFGKQEADLVQKFGHFMRACLTNEYEGAECRYSRKDDVYKSLAYRTNDANAWGADIFVSLHMNAFNGNVSGFESYVYPGVGAETRRLQDCLHNELADLYSDFPDRGQKTANFHVLRESHMPAVLTENLFIDHYADNEFIMHHIREVGERHAHAVAKYFGLKRKTNGGGGNGGGHNSGGTYVVKSGDTLSEIAVQFNTSVSKLANINNIDDPSRIYVGQTIQLPGSKVYHVVQSGDTVSELAVQYGSTVDQINRWNGLNGANVIYVGQKLRVK